MTDKEFFKLAISTFLNKDMIFGIFYVAVFYAAIYLGWWLF